MIIGFIPDPRPEPDRDPMDMPEPWSIADQARWESILDEFHVSHTPYTINALAAEERRQRLTNLAVQSADQPRPNDHLHAQINRLLDEVYGPDAIHPVQRWEPGRSATSVQTEDYEANPPGSYRAAE